jgi:hypothetical protein
MKKYLFVLLILAAASADAELNKWVDQQGKVHYSDQPPAGVEAMPVHAAPPPANTPAPAKSYVEREAELRKAKQSEAEKTQKTAQRQSNAEIEKANCTAAQQTLRSLQQGGRIVEYDEAGERRFLGDDERQRRIAEAQTEIEKFCK